MDDDTSSVFKESISTKWDYIFQKVSNFNIFELDRILL